MAATQSALHCPGCGADLLIISERGLSCARCGRLLRAMPAGAQMRVRAARAVRQFRESQRTRAPMN